MENKLAVGDRFKKFDLVRHKALEKSAESDCSAPEKLYTKILSKNSACDKNILSEMQEILFDKVENTPVWFEYPKEKQQELVSKFFDNKIEDYPQYTISDDDRIKIIEELFLSVSGFGKLDFLLKQDNVSKIILNGRKVFSEISGRIVEFDIELNDKDINFLLKNIYHNAKIDKNTDTTVINCKIDKYLINIVNKKLLSDGVMITIEKQPQKSGFGELINKNFMTENVAEILTNIVQNRKNFIITGGYGAGKTYLADSILTSVLQNFRLSVIEDFCRINTEGRKFSKFSINQITEEKDFIPFLNTIIQTSPEYILTDTKNNYFLAQIFDYASVSEGNIIILPALNSESAMTKAIGLMQLCGYPEKQAKTMFLHSIDYIITVEKSLDYSWRISAITQVTPAKTTTQSLKDIYNINKSSDINTNTPRNSASIRSRFTKI